MVKAVVRVIAIDGLPFEYYKKAQPSDMQNL